MTAFLVQADTPAVPAKGTVTIIPKAYELAFPNPLKGLRSGSLNKEVYPTLTRLYIKWNKIENTETDGVEKIQDYCNKLW
jgi:hypothetical protein